MLKLLVLNLIFMFFSQTSLWALATPSSVPSQREMLLVQQEQDVQKELQQRLSDVVRGLEEILSKLPPIQKTDPRYKSSLAHVLPIFSSILQHRDQFVALTRQGEQRGERQWDHYNEQSSEILVKILHDSEASTYVFSFKEEKDAVGTP